MIPASTSWRAVDRLQRFGQRQRFDAVVTQQQPQPQVGLADATAGIDPRAQRIAAGGGVQPVAGLGHIQQCGNPGARPPRHDFQPLADERPVHPCEWHHVTDRRQRHEVEQPHQVGFGPPNEKPQAAQRPHRRDRGEERHAGGTQHPQAGGAVQPVRVHRRQNGRRPPFGLMMIQHDHVRLAGNGRKRDRGGGAAIDADDQAGAAGNERIEGGRVRAVALLDAIRHVMMHRTAQCPQQADHQRRAAGAINVVIAIDRYGFAALHRIGEAVGGDIHVGQSGRVRQQRAQCRLQEVDCGVDPDTARGEQPTDDLRHLEALRDAGRNAILTGAPQPAPAGQTAGDAQDTVSFSKICLRQPFRSASRSSARNCGVLR